MKNEQDALRSEVQLHKTGANQFSSRKNHKGKTVPHHKVVALDLVVNPGGGGGSVAFLAAVPNLAYSSFILGGNLFAHIGPVFVLVSPPRPVCSPAPQ